MKKILLPTFIALLFLSACNLNIGGIKGNGNVQQKNLNLSGFEGIDAGGIFNIRLKQGAFSVVAETDENLLPHIQATVKSGTLHLNTEKSLNPTERLGVIITMPSVKEIEMSGASFLITEGSFNADKKVKVKLSGASNSQLDITAPEITYSLSGASEAETRGKAGFIEVDASGSSRFNGQAAIYEEMNARLSGSSEADVQVSDKLKVNASGASELRYTGNPSVQSDLSGSASVSRKN